MHIQVKRGFVIRDPLTKTYIPLEGLDVPDADLFYARRLAEGSVEIAESAIPRDAAKQEQKKS
jgi:hypothetical protein